MKTKTDIMKKSIIATGIVASSMLYSGNSSASNEDESLNIEAKTTYLYKWSIVTELGSFSGICSSINAVNKEIALLTDSAKILKKNIIPLTTRNDNLKNQVYTWNVITNCGQASGVSTSLEEAQRIISSFEAKDVIKSNITESL